MPEKSVAELKALIGTTRLTVEGFRIEAGKVAEFARAIKDENPAYRDRDAAVEQGHDAVPAPLTFTRTVLFPRYRPEGRETRFGFDLGFERQYSIHGEQGFEFERPLYVGDVLTGTTTLEDVYQRTGSRGGTMTFAVFATDFVDENDEQVLTDRSTIIETDGSIDDGETT